MKKLILFTLFLSLNCLAIQRPRVLFLSPDPKDTTSEFWQTLYSNLNQSAKDLGVNLEIVYTDSHHTLYEEAIEKILKRSKENLPEYFLGLPPYRQHKVQMLKRFEELGIKVFFVNMAIDSKHRKEIGFPREKYKNWIGHFYPDDYSAGALITEEMAKACKVNRNIVAITGNHLSVGSNLREKAFKDISLKRKLKLQQIFSANWERKNVEKMIPHIESRYPDTCGFVVASDEMAEGILNKAKKIYHVCGVDWTRSALNLIKSGQFLCSAGGHFLEPAFALVTIFDYHNGLDFKDDLGVTYKTPFHLATKQNIESILKGFSNQQVKTYKSFSKFYSKKKHYNFQLVQ